MKRKLRCKLGFHNTIPSKGEILLWRKSNNYFDIIEKCENCGKDVIVGSIELPLPQYMENWNFKILND